MKISDIKPIILELIKETQIQKKSLFHHPGDDILVGVIDDEGEIHAQLGGTHHDLQWKGFGGELWRYSPVTDIVYWHYVHPKKFEELVNDWLKKKGNHVKNHVTLETLKNTAAYDLLYKHAHGTGG